MDLVACYDSDDAEKPPNKKLKTQSIENIEIVDDDEIIEIRTVKKSFSEKPVVCIELDDSDSEEPAAKEGVSKKLGQSATKSDFLHLEDTESDTDEEQQQQVVHNKVNDLLQSAAILNDNICGPDEIDVVPQEAEQNPESVVDRSSTPVFTTSDASTLQNVEVTSTQTFKESNFEADMEKYLRPGSFFMFREMENPASKPNFCRAPEKVHKVLHGHANAISSIDWCTSKYPHLFLSASTDCTLKIWDEFHDKAVQSFRHTSGLKAGVWLPTGEQVVTGGFGKKAYVYDVLSGQEIISYDMYNYVTSISNYPNMNDVFLCGTRNAILGFDVRVNTQLPIRIFLEKCEEVLDIVFLDENEFACSSNLVSKSSSDKTIMVWDFHSGAKMSNQIFSEVEK